MDGNQVALRKILSPKVEQQIIDRLSNSIGTFVEETTLDAGHIRANLMSSINMFTLNGDNDISKFPIISSGPTSSCFGTRLNNFAYLALFTDSADPQILTQTRFQRQPHSFTIIQYMTTRKPWPWDTVIVCIVSWKPDMLHCLDVCDVRQNLNLSRMVLLLHNLNVSLRRICRPGSLAVLFWLWYMPMILFLRR